MFIYFIELFHSFSHPVRLECIDCVNANQRRSRCTPKTIHHTQRHQVRLLLHLDVVGEVPELGVAQEVIVHLRAGDVQFFACTNAFIHGILPLIFLTLSCIFY